MIQTHVYPGNNWFGGLEQYWEPECLEELHRIISKAANVDRFITGIGAHIHRADFMAPESPYQPGFKMTQIISPAISAIYNNNPGYGLL
jgi:hypothetical protein